MSIKALRIPGTPEFMAAIYRFITKSFLALNDAIVADVNNSCEFFVGRNSRVARRRFLRSS